MEAPAFPHFTAGAIETWMKRMRVKPTITVAERPTGFTLTFKW